MLLRKHFEEKFSKPATNSQNTRIELPARKTRHLGLTACVGILTFRNFNVPGSATEIAMSFHGIWIIWKKAAAVTREAGVTHEAWWEVETMSRPQEYVSFRNEQNQREVGALAEMHAVEEIQQRLRERPMKDRNDTGSRFTLINSALHLLWEVILM